MKSALVFFLGLAAGSPESLLDATLAPGSTLKAPTAMFVPGRLFGYPRTTPWETWVHIGLRVVLDAPLLGNPPENMTPASRP